MIKTITFFSLSFLIIIYGVMNRNLKDFWSILSFIPFILILIILTNINEEGANK